MTGELRGPILFARDRVLASAARAIGVESPGRATAVQARIIDIAVQTEVAFVLASLWAERDSVAARAWAESKDGATREAAMVGVLVADGSVGPADRMASLESIADLGWRTRGMYELLRGSSVDEDLWRAVLALREEGDLRAAAICGLAQACLGKRAKLLRGDGGVLDVRTEGASGSSISRPPGVPPDYSQK